MGKNSTIPIPINPRGIELVFEFVDQQEHKVVAKLQLSDTQLIQRYATLCTGVHLLCNLSSVDIVHRHVAFGQGTVLGWNTTG
jgi:hypothetical protein